MGNEIQHIVPRRAVRPVFLSRDGVSLSDGRFIGAHYFYAARLIQGRAAFVMGMRSPKSKGSKCAQRAGTDSSLTQSVELPDARYNMKRFVVTGSLS